MKPSRRPQHRLASAGQIIQQFGQAKLIRLPNGRHQLVDGSAEDWANCRDFICFFQPEVSVTIPH